MKFGIITLFPEMVKTVLEHGVVSRAYRQKLLDATFINPRDYADDARHNVDDRPFGGGPGMVMMAEPLAKSVAVAKEQIGADARVCYFSPQGTLVDQKKIEQILDYKKIILVSGRYEGVDERFVKEYVDEELSIGDYVLSGGELPAMIIMDAVSRLIAGALGNSLSALEDSFSCGLLDCPHYTRPEIWRGLSVPEVLLSGNHKNIEKWRHEQALARTKERRPKIFEKIVES